MNKIRRTVIAEIKERITAIQEELQIILEEEEEYRDNIPDNLQTSERHEKADNACDNLAYAIDNIGEAIDDLEEAIQ